jgi:hypothetical protein
MKQESGWIRQAAGRAQAAQGKMRPKGGTVLREKGAPQGREDFERITLWRSLSRIGGATSL